MRVAQENDFVLLIGNDRRRYLIRLRASEKWHGHSGWIPHADLIGQPLGRTVLTHLGQPYLALPPSTQDLILQQKRTTQIIYPKDAAHIIMRLSLFSGQRVVEAGTGSGGLTMVMARAVMPAGQIYSYEARPEMQDLARRNLDRLNLLPFVTLKLRDIAEGFDEDDADACFLDVRTPQDYLAQAHAAMQQGGIFGSLVPTVNQVIDLLTGIEAHGGFAEVEVEELLVRTYKAVASRLRPADRMVAHTAYLIFARKVAPGDISTTWKPGIRKHYLAKMAAAQRAGEEGDKDLGETDEE
jgi:tRNA (adenine57-N1/adenine58-N1)-methyltransferase